MIGQMYVFRGRVRCIGRSEGLRQVVVQASLSADVIGANDRESTTQLLDGLMVA